MPNHSSEEASIAPNANRAIESVSLLLWPSLVVWFISFFLPAARYDNWGHAETMRGWEAASTAIVLFFVPVKGMLFSFDPHTWAGLLNFFVLAAPFEVKRIKRGQGRVYTIFFVIATAIPVGLVFIPHSLDLASIQAFLIGFYIWTFSLIAAAAWFAWAVWRRWFVLLPSALLAATLFYGLIKR